MIFSGNRCQQVLDGIKTQTRRPVKSGDYALNYWRNPLLCDNPTWGNEIGVVRRGGRDLWRVSQDYAIVPKRGAKQVGRILTQQIRQQVLDDITNDDAIKEGMSGRKEFFEVWESLYGQLDMTQPVWVIDFVLHSVSEDAQ